MKANLLAMGLVSAWLLSPEALVLINRGAGLAGTGMIAALVAGAALAMLAGSVLYDARLAVPTGGSDLVLLRSLVGRRLAPGVLLAGRLPVLLLASTGMLVSAGYAFNEVFLYWFPNFLMAVLLLAGIAALNLLPERYALSFLLATAVATAAGLLFLSLAGIAGGGEGGAAQGAPAGADPFLPGALGMLIFLGFDFLRPGAGSRPVFLALAVALLLASCWVLVALSQVESARLARSMVAYMAVARAVAGEAGHQLMGAIVICGACSGVNGLFLAARRALRDLFGGRSDFFGRCGESCVVTLLAVSVAAMMMAGMAGDRILELQIRGALILWLVTAGVRVAAAGRLLAGRPRVAGYAVGAATFLAAAVLGAQGDDGWYAIRFAGAVLLAMLGVSLFLARLAYSPTLADSK